MIKQGRGKFIPAKQVDATLDKAAALVAELHKIQKLPFATVEVEDSISIYAKAIIEKGESLENVVCFFQADLLKKLIELGYNTDKKLGELLNKKWTTVKVYRNSKGVSLGKK